MRIQWTTQLFIEQAMIMHGVKYIYSDEYIRADVPISIECLDHGHFKQQPRHHLNGHGCPSCFHNKHKNTHEQFIINANKVHNNKYTYVSEYINSRTKITINCLLHGVFKQKASIHLEGKGCPACGEITKRNFVMPKISKMEISWLNSINMPQEYRQYKLQINNKLIMPDAYNPLTKTIYEFYGDYWHGNLKVFRANDFNKDKQLTFGELYQKTMEREKLIKEAGYNIVSIWEYDWKKDHK